MAVIWFEQVGNVLMVGLLANVRPIVVRRLFTKDGIEKKNMITFSARLARRWLFYFLGVGKRPLPIPVDGKG